MKTLVTGGTGFVGSAVVRELLEAGHDVRVLVRKNSNCGNLQGLSVRRIEGDLTDPDSLNHALSGCKALFHVAADYRLWAPDPRHIYEVNVNGTRNVMRAAEQAAVERIVYTSSVATLGHNADQSPADEQSSSTLDEMIGHYKRSKFLAEALVREFSEQNGPSIVTVNPSTPVGPRDIKPTPTGRMVQDAANGRIPAFVDTGLNIVHVDDVAIGHRLAYERGIEGKRYILGGTDMSLKEILTMIAEIVGRRPPRLRLSSRLMLPVAHMAELWTRLRGCGEPLLTVDGLRMSQHHMYFSSERAVQELGYKPRPVQEALEEAVRWFQ
jgi:dihydroflavonol-4-reductase